MEITQLQNQMYQSLSQRKLSAQDYQDLTPVQALEIFIAAVQKENRIEPGQEDTLRSNITSDTTWDSIHRRADQVAQKEGHIDTHVYALESSKRSGPKKFK